jgi:pantothenate synthetase
MLDVIKTADMAEVVYVSVVDPESLNELDVVERSALLSLAVSVEGVRLIDNMLVGE